MLVILLYHRVGKGKYSNTLEMLDNHLQYLKDRYSIILPGDPIRPKKLSLCLTFDDATYDFYHYIFPLLVKYNLRALLGVPTRYILEKTDVTSEERLSVPYPLMMQDNIFDTKAPFCTWKELEGMVRSGFVEVASHSFSHPNLTFPFVKLEREVVLSKKMIEERLPQGVSSFIYPFGKSTPKVDRFVKQHYGYSFRIGSSMHWSWKNSAPFCRVPSDLLKRVDDPLTSSNLISYFSKGLLYGVKNKLLPVLK